MLEQFSTKSDEGLSQSEAEQRLKDYGTNELKRETKVSAGQIFIDQFKNIIVLLLFIAVGISIVIGDLVEAGAVLAVIILNALFGFITEYKAEKSVEALKEMITTKAKVIREGDLLEINADRVVPGDLLVLEEGDRVTADGRFVKADNLAIDEAVLTGESEPVEKNTEPIKEDVSLAEQSNMAFMGTVVTRGNGMAVITATGTNTEMGKISDMLHETEEEVTPLEKKLDHMGKALIKLTLLIAGAVAITGIVSGRPLIEMLETAIALAIAAVPEGLPAVATITLAIGMKKMAQYNALVKSLPAVETLGSTTVICTDKTGTLTENQMTLQQIYLARDEIEVTGSGYEPKGEFKEGNNTIKPQEKKDLTLFLKAGALCSNAVVKQEKSLWKIVGDPTEGALVTAAQKAGFSRQKLKEEGYQRLEELPFTSEAKYMGVLYKVPEGKNMVIIKGAPQVVLGMCNNIQEGSETKELSDKMIKQLKEKNQQLAQDGLRVLAVAYQPQANETENNIETAIESGLTFLGFAGIMDPPRSDVKDAISEAHKAGIRTIMITGDQSDTAQSIAEQVGITDKFNTVLGSDLKDLSMSKLVDKIKNSSVFARVSPKNKLDIVDALNQTDEITAMTGDGVNDAPALKKADIGVAMGKRGTAVARQASDMVLLDDNFATIVQAVKQGRVIFDNIRKFVYYLFSCNLSEIIFIFLGIILQLPVPLLALQILWLNLVTDVFPALVLAWEAPEEEVMSRKPYNPNQEILTSEFKFKIGLHGLVIALGPLLTYLYVLSQGYPLLVSRTIGFITLAFVQLFHVFNARRKEGTGFDQTVFRNVYLWGAIILTTSLQLMAVYLPFLQRVLKTSPLNFKMWSIVIVGSLIPIVIIQLINYIQRSR